MKRLLIGVLAVLAVAGSIGVPTAGAFPDITCRTDRLSSETYVYCHWTDSNGIRHGSVETCLHGSNHCTIREERG